VREGRRGRKEWGGKGGICAIGFRGMDATECSSERTTQFVNV